MLSTSHVTVCTAHDLYLCEAEIVCIKCHMFVLFFVLLRDFQHMAFTNNLVEFRYLSTEEGGEYLDLKRRKCLENEEHL